MRHEVDIQLEQIKNREEDIISKIKTILIGIGFKRTLGNNHPIKILDFEFENENELLVCISKFILRKLKLSTPGKSGFDFIHTTPHNDAKITLHEYYYYVVSRVKFKNYLIELLKQISLGDTSPFEHDPNYSRREFEIMQNICKHFMQKTAVAGHTSKRIAIRNKNLSNTNQEELKFE